MINVRYFAGRNPDKEQPVGQYSWKGVPFGVDNAHVDWQTGKIVSPLYERDFSFPGGTKAAAPSFTDGGEEGRDSGKVSVTGVDEPGFLRDKLDGSLVATPAGKVCLKGEEMGPASDGAFFSCFGGASGFFGIDVLDHPTGEQTLGLNPGEGNVSPDSKGGIPESEHSFSFWVITRLVRYSERTEEDSGSEEEEKGGKLAAMYRKLTFSPMGRLLSISGEVMRDLGEMGGSFDIRYNEDQGYLQKKSADTAGQGPDSDGWVNVYIADVQLSGTKLQKKTTKTDADKNTIPSEWQDVGNMASYYKIRYDAATHQLQEQTTENGDWTIIGGGQAIEETV